MTTRRSIIRGAGFLAAALGAAGSVRPAAAAQSPGIAALENLKGMPGVDNPVFIPGHGWFESTLADGESDGVVRIAGPDGRHWCRTGFDGALRPDWFARAEDGLDQALAIQRACDHAARFGPYSIELGGTYHRCLTPIRIDPTRVALRGAGARLDYSYMPEPPDRTIATLDDIPPTEGWRREDLALVHEEGSEIALARDLALPGEGRYRFTLEIGALDGATDYPAVYLSVLGAGREELAKLTAVAPGPYTFEVEGSQQAARLVIETHAAARINSLRITYHGRRECVLVAAKEASPQYGHKWIEGLEIIGPGNHSSLQGIRFETHAMSRSSRIDIRDVTVRGFGTGLIFSHRAYLVRGAALRIACDVAMHFLGALEDAGELITLQGSVIDGGRIAVLNNNAEVALFGTSIDFVDQVFVGSGRLILQGCHLEVNRPKSGDKPLVDLGAGNVTIDGGSFSVTGSNFEAGNLCEHIFELRSRGATASMREVSTYNLRSTSGALAGGPGRLDTALIRGHRPRHLAPIVQFDASRNLLGPLPLDLRASEGPKGGFQFFPTASPTFKASPSFRCLWVVGSARPGSEVGVHFRVWSDVAGTLHARLHALSGEDRNPIGEGWWLDVGPEWQMFLGDSGDTHPSAGTCGRMPEGCENVALMLDLTAIDGTVEIANPFLSTI